MSEQFQALRDQAVLRDPRAPREMTFQEWIDLGISMGFCSELICVHHDEIPVTEIEEDELEFDSEMCLPLVRIWQTGDVLEC